MSMEQALDDLPRLEYYKGNLEALLGAMDDGVVIKSYFAWSLMDNFEWYVWFASDLLVTS